mmetsp:Transcript_15407/g.23228  ORF Transcript_15407/g.23228 Transcript_15407/m.23228 type:complete len:745 (+) Transcript_15407:73-2307(+)
MDLMEGETNQSAYHQLYHLNVLLHPNLLPFLSFSELAHLSELSREYAAMIKTCSTDCGYWHAMCISFSGQYGLYLPSPLLSPREYFFNCLWISRRKWQAEENSQQNFKIHVSSRFRPGEKCQKKFALPLHQFLKVRSQQKSGQKDRIFVGENAPENYVDGLLGTLMQDPVMLPDSQRVLDRSVAISCVLRGGKDPFSGAKLTMESLIPLPDLAQEIAVFRKRQKNVDIGVEAEDVMGLVDDVDPRLLEALVAAEQLQCVSRRAQLDVHEREYRARTGQDITPVVQGVVAVDEVQPEEEELEFGEEDIIEEVRGEVDEREANDSSEEMESQQSGGETADSSDELAPRWRQSKAESARIISVSREKATVTMSVPGSGIRPFHFNKVFPDRDGQARVYDKSARDIVVSALNGMNGCLLCYGQTGSGKTHTMFGKDYGSIPNLFQEGKDDIDSLEDICRSDSGAGVVHRAFAEVLRAKKIFERRGEVALRVTLQFVEIYNERATDLMTGNRVSVRRATGELHGAVEVPIECMTDAATALQTGNARKHFAATAMNDHSSRSHTAIVLHLAQYSANTHTQVKSHLYLVDLAGSERVKKSKAQGAQLREARAINSSLLVLGKVISRLSHSEYHVPYYESLLTTMLKAAFGGNSRTGVIVTCRSDDKVHGDETLQSLRFGELCGMISNSTRTAASSIESVVKRLDDGIIRVQKQIDSLKEKGRTDIPTFFSLEMNLSDLKTKRNDIAKISSL